MQETIRAMDAQWTAHHFELVPPADHPKFSWPAVFLGLALGFALASFVSRSRAFLGLVLTLFSLMFWTVLLALVEGLRKMRARGALVREVIPSVTLSTPDHRTSGRLPRAYSRVHEAG